MLQRIAALLRFQPPVVDTRGLLYGSGADYPTLGSDGWQIGAIWANTTGAAGTSLYVNEGSVTSCDFVAVDTTAGASAGALNFDDNVTGPLISIETTTPTNDSYTTPFIITGAYSSLADNALVVSATNTRPVSFLFEDGGDAFTGGDIRAGLFRLLLTVDQAAAVTINALRAQIKANNEVDITSPNSVTAPLTGYLELDGAGARHLDGHVACVRAALETGAGAHTVDINLCGFESTLNSSGTFTAAKLFAYTANISGGTTTWQFGYKVEDDSCDVGVGIGTCGSGIVLLGTFTTGIDFTNATLAMDANRTNSAIAIGDRLGAKTITFAAAVNHFDPIQINLLTAGVNPTADSTVNSIYQLITHAVDMSGLRLKCADWNIVTSKDVKDMYVYQAEIDVTAASVTVGNQAAGLGITMNAGADAVTCGYWEGIAVTMTGAGTPAATSQGFYLSVASGCTIASGILLSSLGAMTAGITLSGAGTFATGIDIDTCTIGIDIAGCVTPNSTRTNHALVIGGRSSELSVAFASGVGVESYEPIQMNFDFAGYNPDSTSTVNIWQGAITLDTDALANVRLKWSDLLTTVSKNCMDVYVHQAEIVLSGTTTISNEVAVLGLVCNAGSGTINCGTYNGVNITMRGSATPATASGLMIHATSSCVLPQGISIYGNPQITVGIAFGNVANDNQGPSHAFFIPSGPGADVGPHVNTAKSGDGDGSIKIKVGSTTKYLQYWDDAA